MSEIKISGAFDGTKAKVGDRVFSLRFEWGTIINTSNTPAYPIVCSFDDAGTERTYTIDGKIDIAYSFSDLFYGPPEIIGPEKPKRMVKKEVNLDVWIDNGGVIRNIGTLDCAYNHLRCVHLTGTYEVIED